MNTVLHRAAFAALLLGTAAAGTFAMETAAYAAAARAPAGPTVSRRVGPPLVESQKAVNAGDLALALTKAKEADAVADKTPYDNYQIARVLAAIYIRQMDFTGALTAYERCIETGAAPDAEKGSNFSMATLLSYNAKDYAKTIKYGVEAKSMGALDDQGQMILTQSYFLSNDFAGAERLGKEIIMAKAATGAKPDKRVYEFIYNSQLKLNNQARANETLEQLTLADPTPDNWRRLIDRGFTIPGVTEPQLLNLYRLRVLTNAMDATDYLAMAGASLQQGLPEEAKNMLQKGMMAGTLPADRAQNLLTQAQQMGARDAAALADLEKAGAAAREGETDVKLGESLYAYGRLADAETALKRGIGKGGVKDVANANLVLGIVLLAQGKKDEARQAFAGATSAQVTPIAHLWTVYSQG